MLIILLELVGLEPKYVIFKDHMKLQDYFIYFKKYFNKNQYLYIYMIQTEEIKTNLINNGFTDVEV